MSDLQTKTCAKCLETKGLGEFSKSKGGKFGIKSHCKSCCNIYSKARRPIEREQRRKKYATDPEYNARRTRENREYRSNPINRAKEKETQKRLNRRYRKEKPEFRILESVRRRVRYALNGKSKSKKTLELLGCSSRFLRTYLESKWKAGMSWENYGFYGWHIDHVKPCSSFDLLDSEQQKACFNYTNLQPLWAHENFSKSDKMPDAF